jgi:hypothetical protein
MNRNRFVASVGLLLLSYLVGCERPPETDIARAKKPTNPVQEPQNPTQPTDPNAPPDAGQPSGEIDWTGAFDQDPMPSPTEKAQLESPLFTQFSVIGELKIIQQLDCRASLCRIVIELNPQDEAKVLHELSKADTPVSGMGMTWALRVPNSNGTETVTIYLHKSSTNLDALPKKGG